MKKLLFLIIPAIFLNFTSCDFNKKTVPTINNRETLKVEIFDRSDALKGFAQISDSYLTDWIQKNFGEKHNINVEFVTVVRANEVKSLNTFIATGTGPDILFTYNPYNFATYVKNDKLHDLTDVLNKNGENLKSFLTDDVLDCGKIDGRQYAIPAKRMNQGKFVSYIRKDWLDKLSLPIPQSTEELVSSLQKFKDEDPGGVGKKNVIPFSSDAGSSAAVRTILNNFYSGNRNGIKTDFTNQDYKNGVKFLNNLYNSGILVNSLGIDGNSVKHYENIISGNVGYYVDGNSTNTFKKTIEIFNLLKENVPKAEYVACDPITNGDGKHYKEIYDNNGLYIFVPKYSKNAENAIKYLNWMAEKDVLETIQHGILGEHYKKENGKYVPINSEKNSVDLFNSFDISIIINGYNAENIEKSIEAEANTFGEYKNLYMDAYKISINDGLPDGFNLSNIKELKYIENLAMKIDEFLIRCITADENEFESIYNQVTNEFVNISVE